VSVEELWHMRCSANILVTQSKRTRRAERVCVCVCVCVCEREREREKRNEYSVLVAKLV
jgi:hypothetical protein